MKGSRYIAETIKGYGTDHVFFVEAILRATLLEMHEVGIKRVLAHSEKAAAYMADGYARSSGGVGVCMSQSVGAANLASGLQEAWLAGSPVLALTGKKPPMLQYRNSYQEIDHGPLFAPVTKYNVAVDTARQLPHILPQAFREATTGCPRPVHLDMPDHQGAIVESEDVAEGVVVEPRFGRVPPFRPTPDERDVEAAARALETAARPLLVVGGGAVKSGAGAEVKALAERLSLPIVTSVDGMGIVPGTHPLFVGPVGRYSRSCANKAVSRADLVFYVGCHTGDQVSHDWRVPARGVTVIQLDIDPLELGRSYPNAVQLLGDARVGLGALAATVDPARAKRDWAREVQGLVAEWKAEMEPLRRSDAVPIRPERLCRELSAALPDDAVVVADTGHSSIWTGTLLDLTAAEQRYIRCTGGSLGWALPAALGVKCGSPDRPVVCFCGDGGFWYHMAELETARRCGISTVTVVNQNNALGQCITGIKQVFGNRDGRAEDLYQFSSVRLCDLARDMGIASFRAETPEAIGPAIRDALGCGGPALVEVVTDPLVEPQLPWRPQS